MFGLPAEEGTGLRVRERGRRAGELGGGARGARVEAGEQLGERLAGEGVVGADEEHLAVGDVAERAEQRVGESGDIAGVHVIEQRRGRQCRVIESLAHRVSLLGGRARPFLGGDHVAGAEGGEPHVITRLSLQHSERLLDEQLRERIRVPRQRR
jgi:hypothetical protein